MVLAIVPVWIAGSALLKAVDLSKNGIHTVGTVQSSHIATSGPRKRQFLVVTIKYDDFTKQFGSNPHATHKGETVRVAYPSSDPDAAVLLSANPSFVEYISMGWLGVAALLFLAFCLVSSAIAVLPTRKLPPVSI